MSCERVPLDAETINRVCRCGHFLMAHTAPSGCTACAIADLAKSVQKRQRSEYRAFLVACVLYAAFLVVAFMLGWWR